ncbi:acyl carrier protein [Streptomyces sp. NPDC007205]|uniref:acyl carrier protein n=1 Tax=Streptomyces sp. NPDC007205 TaxID=3154316 RepID=UPI0033E7CFB7
MEPADLRHILIAELGLDAETLDQRPDTPLIDLGLDSLGRAELRAILRGEHGMALPEGIGALTLAELTDQLCMPESR